ncbi:hypothetical protein M2164_005878 [Streptomyces sp. SAI-208]|uniref:hypothetical protein n=1 Tax=Streptomyces sp. SAI-208 TaxID=2940550 RepID=UPI00247349A5|nr:hypothetical protein [Streptomyces sp. SAI-208]MDH6610243.1 hypothetical protein [Streptomyces sp. SAI-208]
MTGPEHYQEAERLLAESAVDGAEGTYFVRPENLAAAQAHATLALAAATALSAPVEDDLAGFTVEDRDAWFKAAGEKPGTDYDVRESFA